MTANNPKLVSRSIRFDSQISREQLFHGANGFKTPLRCHSEPAPAGEESLVDFLSWKKLAEGFLGPMNLGLGMRALCAFEQPAQAICLVCRLETENHAD
jgi:hypothetical protein